MVRYVLYSFLISATQRVTPEYSECTRSTNANGNTVPVDRELMQPPPPILAPITFGMTQLKSFRMWMMLAVNGSYNRVGLHELA